MPSNKEQSLHLTMFSTIIHKATRHWLMNTDYCTTGLRLCKVPVTAQQIRVRYRDYALMGGIRQVGRNGLNSLTMYGAMGNTTAVDVTTSRQKRYLQITDGIHTPTTIATLDME